MAYADKDKERATRRRHYYKYLEVNRAKGRDKKRRARKRRRDEINANARKWYAKNRYSEARKQNLRRRKRLPYIGLRTAIRDCEAGTLSFNELIEQLSRSLAWSDEIMCAARRLGPDDRRIHRPKHETVGKKRLRHNSN